MHAFIYFLHFTISVSRDPGFQRHQVSSAIQRLFNKGLSRAKKTVLDSSYGIWRREVVKPGTGLNRDLKTKKFLKKTPGGPQIDLGPFGPLVSLFYSLSSLPLASHNVT